MKRVCTTVSLLLCMSCLTSDNPYDPTNPDYVVPYFTIDSSATSVFDGDTLVTDTADVGLLGGDRGNQFRWRLDSTAWSAWDDPGDPAYTITLTGIDTGLHTLDIQTCYSPDGDITDTTLSFYRAAPATITAAAGPVHELYAGATCTLWVRAAGTAAIEYIWYRDTVAIDTTNSDTLTLLAVTAADSGSYSCRVSNRWGADTSATFSLSVTVAYSVVYHPNEATGGSVPADKAWYEQGESVTVLANNNDLVRHGYTFLGWNTASDGSGDDYGPGTSFTIDTIDVVLYAKWEQIPAYRVVYDANGATDGDVPVDSRLYEQGEEVTVRGNSDDLVKTGHTFEGWTTAPDGGTGYDPGDTFVKGATDDTLYAAWVIDTYTVVFISEDTLVDQQRVLYA
ncbi:MAG: hypothetical protein GF331_11155, partial [Chitinivibrionales bacterium]|nr:hypothetical protein [Chitinivibrionales bacterium]